MKKISFLFALSMCCAISTVAQLQYTAVPRSGEGRFDRSSEATFWANPIFFKPSIFFYSEGASSRPNRKWWRNAERYLPVPDTLPTLRGDRQILSQKEWGFNLVSKNGQAYLTPRIFFFEQPFLQNGARHFPPRGDSF